MLWFVLDGTEDIVTEEWDVGKIFLRNQYDELVHFHGHIPFFVL